MATATMPDIDDEPRPRWHGWFGWLTQPDTLAMLQGAVTAVTVVGCALFVLAEFQPDLILRNTTPTGGDMGSHVWTAAYLRDHLLPHGQLVGWSPDWYAGFPVLQFYMLPPMLLIALLSYVIPYGIAFKLVAVSGMVAMPASGYLFGRLSRLPFPTPAFLAVACTAFVFERSFSIYGGNAASTLAGEFSFAISLAVAIVYLGLVGRGLGDGGHRVISAALLALTILCHVIPTFFAVAATGVWLVVWFGRDLYESVGSLEAGRWGLLARANLARVRWAATVGVTGALLASFWLLPFWAKSRYVNDMGWEKIAQYTDALFWRRHLAGGGIVDYPTLSFFLALAFVGLIVSIALRRRSGVFLAATGLVAAAAFVWLPQWRLWNARVLPFWYLCIYLLAAVGAGLMPVLMRRTVPRRRVGAVVLASVLVVQLVNLLAPTSIPGIGAMKPDAWGPQWGPMLMVGIVVLTLVAAAELASMTSARRRAVAWGLVVGAVVLLALMRVHPEWRAATHLLGWSLAMLVLVAVGAILEFLEASRDERPAWGARVLRLGGSLAALAVMWLYLALPLHALGPLGHHDADGTYSLAGLDAVSTKDDSFVDSWAAWNFAGYEAGCDPTHGDPCAHGDKPYWPEYHALIATMTDLGESRGCGRAMWEHNPEYEHYGTPMALMLLPFWTDGCIGSMEGLYFESSTTTPYHFINQDELSDGASNPQRGLPYVSGVPTPEQFDLGVRHLQMLGVRYYIAYTDTLIGYARDHPDLTEVATSPAECLPEQCPPGVDPPTRFVIFEVGHRPLVEPLENQPVVITGVGSGHTCETAPTDVDPRGRVCKGWLDPAIEWYMDPSYWSVPLAESGPADWARIPVDEWLRTHDAPKTPTQPAKVSNVETGRQNLSFDVDRVGQPILVKVSYFPNWQASGADGPYRVTPNLMVVVPTERHVELHYGRTTVDLAGWAATLVGLGLVVVLWRRPPLEMPPGPVAAWRRPAMPGPDESPDTPTDAPLPVGVVGGEPPGPIDASGTDDASDVL